MKISTPFKFDGNPIINDKSMITPVVALTVEIRLLFAAYIILFETVIAVMVFNVELDLLNPDNAEPFKLFAVNVSVPL